MKYLVAIAFFLLSACTAPETSDRFSTVEMVSLDGRIIQIEEKREFYVGLSAFTFANSSDVRGKTFAFFDFCRETPLEWKMVVVMPNETGEADWNYVLTHFMNKQDDGKWEEKATTRGILPVNIRNFGDLKAAGLDFFEPNLFGCEPPSSS